jgi:hypothetical protein
VREAGPKGLPSPVKQAAPIIPTLTPVAVG